MDKDTMLGLAEEQVLNAPNNDWRGRGSLSIDGEIRCIEIKGILSGKKMGDADVAFIKFERPLVDNFRPEFAFTGFVLTAMKVGRKTIMDTSSVIGGIKEEHYRRNHLSNRFCSQCHSLDSVKHKSKRMGPECIKITYKCNKCSYVDYDVFD